MADRSVDTNKNVNWMDARGFWVFYSLLLLTLYMVMPVLLPPPNAWTGVNVIHGVVWRHDPLERQEQRGDRSVAACACARAIAHAIALTLPLALPLTSLDGSNRVLITIS